MQNSATKRTINLLADSLKNLLNVKEINKITINEITKDSGVNRQTFYYHFHDIYELCSYMIERDLQELMPSRGNDVTDWKIAMITLLEYLEENKNLYKRLILTVGSFYINQFIHDNLKPYVKAYITRYIKPTNITSEYIEFLYGYYTASFHGCIIDWILFDGIKNVADKNELVDLIDITVEGSLEHIVERFEGKKDTTV